MIRIFDIADSFDFSAELEPLAGQLPEWRMAKMLSYRFDADRFLCAKAYVLLRECLAEAYDLRDFEFSYSENGKPSILGRPDIHFSLSHCRRGVACVVGDGPVGCDIELIPGESDMGLWRRLMNEKEMERIQASADPAVEFAVLWTMKEALLKATGEGLRDDMRTVLDDVKEFGFDTRVSDAWAFTVCRQIYLP